MHIGINAQLLSQTNTYRATGVSNYISSLLRGLSQCDSYNRYTVFTGAWARESGAREKFCLGANFRWSATRMPTAYPPIRLIWEQTAQAAHSLNMDVLHSPVNVVPLMARPRRVVT